MRIRNASFLEFALRSQEAGSNMEAPTGPMVTVSTTSESQVWIVVFVLLKRDQNGWEGAHFWIVIQEIGTRLSNHPLTQSAMQCSASVHTLHMPKPVVTFVFKVLRNALLRSILYTCCMAAKTMRSRCHWRLALAFFLATFSLVFAIESAIVENMWGW